MHEVLYTVFPFSVPSSPADIKAVTSGDASMIVSWRAPTLPNGIIQKYTVYRREIISGKEVMSGLCIKGFGIYI